MHKFSSQYARTQLTEHPQQPARARESSEFTRSRFDRFPTDSARQPKIERSYDYNHDKQPSYDARRPSYRGASQVQYEKPVEREPFQRDSRDPTYQRETQYIPRSRKIEPEPEEEYERDYRRRPESQFEIKKAENQPKAAERFNQNQVYSKYQSFRTEARGKLVNNEAISKDGHSHQKRNQSAMNRIAKRQPETSVLINNFSRGRNNQAEYGQFNSHQMEKQNKESWQDKRQNFNSKKAEELYQKKGSSNINSPERIRRQNTEHCSSERKQSLIEKSQLLREKLKKLNQNLPVQNNEDTPSPAFKDDFAKSSRRESRSSKGLQSFQSVNMEVSINRPSLRERGFGDEQDYASKMQTKHDSQPSVSKKDDALAKISQLNEKINQRIQNLINNFSTRK